MKDHHQLPDDGQGQVHKHGVIDPTLLTTGRGIWAIKWSFSVLAVTAVLQLAVVVLTGSVALLADTIHNAGDALTAIPLWIAFLLARRKPNPGFTYGFGRVEDLAGAFIVLMILASGVLAGYASVDRLINPRTVDFVWAVAAAGAIGFIGNEAVARFRMRVGREINSEALVADGNHARVDGLTSLAVLAGAIAIGLGYPIADPIVGLAITVLIGKIVWDSAKAVFSRMLDSVDPEIVQQIEHLASHIRGVAKVSYVRARWLGHRLEAEVHVTADGRLSLEEAHELASSVEHGLDHEFPFLASTLVHVDPLGQSGIDRHHTPGHEHDGLSLHAH